MNSFIARNHLSYRRSDGAYVVAVVFAKHEIRFVAARTEALAFEKARAAWFSAQVARLAAAVDDEMRRAV